MPLPPRRPRYPPSRPYNPNDEAIINANKNLATLIPRKAERQIIWEIDEAFSLKEGEFRYSVRDIFRRPHKVLQRAIKTWVAASTWGAFKAELEVELVWKPRLIARGIAPADQDAIFRWVRASPTESVNKLNPVTGRWEAVKLKSIEFRNLEVLHAAGRIDPHTWNAILFRQDVAHKRLILEYAGKGNVRGFLKEITRGPYGGTPAWRLAFSRESRLIQYQVVRNITGGVANAVRPAGQALRAAARWTARQLSRGAVGSALRALFSSASATIGGALGSLGVPVPVVGALVGAVVGFAFEKTLKFMGKVTLWGCGCAVVAFATLVGIIAVGIFAAFGLNATGGGMSGTAPVVVEKTANPSSISVGPNQEVEFRITVRNNSGKEISNLSVVDDYDQANISSLSVLGGGSDDGDKWTFKDPVTVVPPGASAAVSYRAWIIADADKTVVNNVTFTGTIDGSAVSANGSAFVVVGTGGEGRPPSEWPVAHGRITQGPYAPGGREDSHRTQAAIDIAAPLDSAVFATHDGTVQVYRNCGGPYPVLGDYVVITSPRGFKSIYGHLLDISVVSGWTAAAGQKIGSVGGTGAPSCQKSTGAHLHYEFKGLPMGSPYIPKTIGPCLNPEECDYRF